MGDYLKPPMVDAIVLTGSTGQIGDKIAILAVDDTAVVAAHVTIRDANGATLEQGPAVNTDGAWIYTATTLMPLGQQVFIEVTARDRPGNLGDNSAQFTRTA